MTKHDDRPWTDYELGFIQDHDDWTAARIATELGRTRAAVYVRRRMLRTGWSPTGKEYWSKAEDDFLLANPRMSGPEAASHLGRTASSVKNRRLKLRRDGHADERFGGNWSPLVAGARPLLAKTCPDCGLLLQAMWFNLTSGGRTRLCNRCRHASGQSRHRTQRQEAQTRESMLKRQALTISGATQAGQPWTESDFKILADPDMTLLQKALTLHRTYHATVSACGKNGLKSHVGLGDPERDQWIIDNPSAGRAMELSASFPKLPELVMTGRPNFEWDD